MRVIELGSTVAAEAYLAAQQHELAEGDRVRRDLLEDLLARRNVPAGPKRAMLRAAGLGADTEAAGDDGGAGRGAVGRQRRFVTPPARWGGPATRGPGLAVARQDEIVGVTPLPRGGAAAVVANLRRACDELARRQVRLAVGVSTVRGGLHEIPEAYAEARVARDGLGASTGVLALPMLTSSHPGRKEQG